MNILLDKVSKRYGSQWIFRNVDYSFEEGYRYAITGSNGAGKSTLLNILVGKTPYTKGKINYLKDDKKIGLDDVYQYFSIATTSMNLIEEFTLEELVKFHFRFRKSISMINTQEVVALLELANEKKKFIHNFSSGMRQRLKIGLAVLSDSDVVVLDEPGANLDDKSKIWFQMLINEYIGDRTLIIASNEAQDYKSCQHILDLATWK